MAEHEPDGVNDAFQAAARVAITVGGLIAERMIRAREQAIRDAQVQSEQATVQTYWRIDAERNAAVASLAPIREADWWARASARDIGDMWEVANTWSRGPHAHAVALLEVERMRDELRSRYAVDPDSLDADRAWQVQDEPGIEPPAGAL